MEQETTPHWMEIVALIPEENALRLEGFEAALLGAFPGGFASEDATAPPMDGGRPRPEKGWTRYLIYVAEEERETALAQLGHLVIPWPQAEISAAKLDDGWRLRWKEYFKPRRVSERIVVSPPWERLGVEAGEQEIIIEAAMAFGTGQHETTELCLRGVDAYFATNGAGARVLDVGTGTGVLALAAVGFGASEALGIDNDAVAVLASQDNLELNPAIPAKKLIFETTPVEEIAGVYDLVLANILTPVLVRLAAPISAKVGEGGTLMLSGILSDQEPEILKAYEAQGLAHAQTERKNNWVRIDFVRPRKA